MNNIFLEFTYGNIRLEFEDDEYANLFKSVFDTVDTIDETYTYKFIVKGNTNLGYCIDDGNTEKYVKSREEASCYIMNLLGNLFCNSVGTNIYMMHAASVLLDDKVVSFSGISGSGKTSLALLFSKYGTYMGDEYAYLDVLSGYLWHEKHPFQLKEGNHKLLELFENENRLIVKDDSFGTAYYISTKSVNNIMPEVSRKSKMRFLIYPTYDENCSSVIISKIQTKELPMAVLQSVMGKCLPSQVFRSTINLIARNRIALIKVRFSDGEKAAEELYEYIQGVLENEI